MTWLRRRKIRRQLCEALEQLGDTPDQVAVHLLGLGIKGMPTDAARCPVALYLRAKLDSPRDPYASRVVVGVYVYKEGHQSVEVVMPNPVSTFIQRFDGGYHYSALRASDGELRSLLSVRWKHFS